METGDRIKRLRTSKGMTQEELGKILGVGKAAIQKYEKGIVKNLKRSSIIKLANALECSPSYLMGWEDESDDNYHILKIYNSLNEKGRKRALSLLKEFTKIDEYRKEEVTLKIVARTGKTAKISRRVDRDKLDDVLSELGKE